MVTVLHLSDLHRDAESRLTTASLLESLRLDRERYVCKGVSTPDIAIVSGDIVFGVDSDEAGSDAALRRQYSEAQDFLARLADDFFAGDRERVILVPGNHDVSHPHVLRATTVEDLPADRDQRAVLAHQLAADDGTWRWVQSEFALRRIVDHALYRERLKPFADFYRSFYGGTRCFSLNPGEQFALHDFPKLGIAIVGLSSCCDNDLFNRSGKIHADCVAGATRAVADLLRVGRLPIAVWHHSLSGGPRDSDYVDPGFLQSLMDGGFVMGLHGHQHRPQFLEHRFTADRKKSLAVISAGTACGGPHSLPPGRMRAYNLVSLDSQAGTASLHVREMKNTDFGLPVWGAAAVPDFGGPAIEFPLCIPDRTGFAFQVASEAADLLGKGDPASALAIAREHADNDFARRVVVKALVQLEDWSGLIGFCNPPRSNSEIVAVFEALYQLADRAALRRLVESADIARNRDAAVRQSVEQAIARLGGNR